MSHITTSDVLDEAVNLGFEAARRRPKKDIQDTLRREYRDYKFLPAARSDSLEIEQMPKRAFFEDIIDITTVKPKTRRSQAAKKQAELSDASRKKHGPLDAASRYEKFMKHLDSQGLEINAKKSDWNKDENEKLERRIMKRVGEVAEELHDKYNKRCEQLNGTGAFDTAINKQRAEGMFHTELLRKLKFWDLQKHVERDIHATTPNTYIESKMDRSGTWEARIEAFVRKKDEEIERERAALLAPPARPSPAANSPAAPLNTAGVTKAKAMGRRGSRFVAENNRKAVKAEQLAEPRNPANTDDHQSTEVSAVSPVPEVDVEKDSPGDPATEAGTGPTLSPPTLDGEGKAEAEEGAAADAAEAESSDELEGADGAQGAQKEQLEGSPADDKEVRRRRRHRRRQQPPDYIAYAKMREQQILQEDDRALGKVGGGRSDLWPVDYARYSTHGEEDAPAKSKQLRNPAPLTRVPEDVLQPKHDKAKIGVHYKWEDLAVEHNVVLRTALPAAPTRVPQLVLSDTHAEARSIHELGPSITQTTTATRPARALVSEVYAAETANLGSDETMLPGAAPADFQGLDARLKTPKLNMEGGRGPRREAQRDKLEAQKAAQKAAQKRQEAVPTLDVALQRRLETVWDILQVPPMDKLEHVLKYSKVEYSSQLEESLAVWEAVGQCVERREQLLRELNNLKNNNSALKGGKAVRERMSRLAVALCEHTRDAQLIRQLKDEYADEVQYHGLSYWDKIQSDLSDELIALLPENYEYQDLLESN